MKEMIQNAVDAIRAVAGARPSVGLILGSGLGGLADVLEDASFVEYASIPGFPVSTAPGHAGRFVLGLVENMSYVLCPDCGKKIDVFGESHVAETAAEFGVPVLARIPIDPQLARQADLGVIESFEGDMLDGAADAIEKLL